MPTGDKADKTLLLVEDNPDEADLTLLAIERAGVRTRVAVARDGDEALDCLLGSAGSAEPNRPLPYLVLLDLKMPRTDGLDVLRRLRAAARTRLVPVVILTSSGLSQDVTDCYLAGANSYVRKPVDFLQFTETVRQLVTYWLLTNEPAPFQQRETE